MEATIGPILSKVDSVLERIDDMKKAKKKKRETIQRLMETIEDNEGCKCYLISTKCFIKHGRYFISVDEKTKNQQIKELAEKMESRPNSGM